MKKKFKIKTIEDIALQYIKHSNDRSFPKKISSNDTIVDTKFYIKKYLKNRNYDSILSSNFSKLILDEDSKKNENTNSKLKIIKFHKIPQKNLVEDEEFLFMYETRDKSKSKLNPLNNKINSEKIKLREIKNLKYNKKKKILFDINYKNTNDCLKEIYNPLLQNLETISSLKSNTENTISCIEFFCSHSSIFELNENKNNNTDDIISEILNTLKIFEIIEFCLVLFILHIILEAKIEYIDSFNEDDILVIYNNSLEVMKKLYDIIMLILQLNIKSNNSNTNNNKTNKDKDKIILESLYNKYIKEYYKIEPKISNNIEEIINKINDNINFCLKALFNSCNILFENLVLFKKESGNLDYPDEEEIKFISKLNKKNNSENKNIDKIYLSKEFNDQYTSFKTMYLFLTNNNDNKKNKEKEKDNKNYDFLSNSETDSILSKLTTVFSSFKEIYNCILLYYTNFKILLEKNKVKPPFLGPPVDPKKIFTLVVDLDETLVHYVEEENRAYVQVRPYADYFLTEMGKYFEIVIFTAAAEDYADIVLNELDKNKAINYKLYRKHTEQINGVFIKDLSKIGRDINKIVIVDNNRDNFSLQPENGLHICSFLGDQNDDELLLLSKDLMKIVKGNKKDLRPAIKEIDQIMKKRYKEKNVVLE